LEQVFHPMSRHKDQAPSLDTKRSALRALAARDLAAITGGVVQKFDGGGGVG
jgi:hypothetical protein